MSIIYNTNLQLAGGISKSIGDLVENRDKERTYKILSYNIKDNKQEYKRILNFYKISTGNKQLMTVLIKLNNQIIKIICTDDHKFYICDKNVYIEAKELLENYTILTYSIQQGVQQGKIFKAVKSVQQEQFIYDIEVEDNYNFFTNNILVHS